MIINSVKFRLEASGQATYDVKQYDYVAFKNQNLNNYKIAIVKKVLPKGVLEIQTDTQRPLGITSKIKRDVVIPVFNPATTSLVKLAKTYSLSDVKKLHNLFEERQEKSKGNPEIDKGTKPILKKVSAVKKSVKPSFDRSKWTPKGLKQSKLNISLDVPLFCNTLFKLVVRKGDDSTDVMENISDLFYPLSYFLSSDDVQDIEFKDLVSLLKKLRPSFDINVNGNVYRGIGYKGNFKSNSYKSKIPSSWTLSPNIATKFAIDNSDPDEEDNGRDPYVLITHPDDNFILYADDMSKVLNKNSGALKKEFAKLFSSFGKESSLLAINLVNTIIQTYGTTDNEDEVLLAPVSYKIEFKKVEW